MKMQRKIKWIWDSSGVRIAAVLSANGRFARVDFMKNGEWLGVQEIRREWNSAARYVDHLLPGAEPWMGEGRE